MKTRLYRVVCILLCGLILSMSTPAYAKTVDRAKTNKVVKSRIIDKNGNETIDYYNLNYLPEFYYSTTKSKAAMKTSEAGVSAFAVTTPPTYTSTLTGAYDNYTYAMAVADSTQAIDNIFVTMQAWLAHGTYVGTDTHTNPTGTTASTQTASLQVPVNPFNFQFGSAYSQHTYTCTGYEFVSHALSWNK